MKIKKANTYFKEEARKSRDSQEENERQQDKKTQHKQAR